MVLRGSLNSMEPQTQKTQIIELLRASENLVITVNQRPDNDQIAAAIGLAEILHKLNKHADVVISGAVPSNLSFLSTGLVKKSFSGIRDFVIDVDTSNVEADKLRYVPEGKKLRIYVTPFNGNYSAEDVDFSYGDYHCDAIIALGVDGQEQMDKQIANQKELLSKSKLVTLNVGDGSGAAGLNWHVATASSVCELVMNIVESMQPDILDGDIATSLLTGIISNTDHFTNERTSARVMNIASQLMAVGAKQADIIEHLKKPATAPGKPDDKEHKPPSRVGGLKPKTDGELESGQTQELPHKGKKVESDEPKLPVMPAGSPPPRPEPDLPPAVAPLPPASNTSPPPITDAKPSIPPPAPDRDMLPPLPSKPVVENNPFDEPLVKPPVVPPVSPPPLPPMPKPPGVSDVHNDAPLGTAPPPLAPLVTPPNLSNKPLQPLPPLPPTQPGDVAQPGKVPLPPIPGNTSAPVAPPVPPQPLPPIPPSASAAPKGVPTSPPAPNIALGSDGKPDIEAARKAVEEAEKSMPTPPPPPLNPPSSPAPPPPPAP